MANQEAKKSQLGSSSPNSYFLSWFKGIAVNPCGTLDSPKASFKRPWNQALRTRILTLLSNPDCPEARRRHLEESLKQTQLSTDTSPAPEELNGGVTSVTNLVSPPDSVSETFLPSMVPPTKVWLQPSQVTAAEPVEVSHRPNEAPCSGQVTVMRWDTYQLILPPLSPVIHAQHLLVKSPTPTPTPAAAAATTSNAVADESIPASLAVASSDKPEPVRSLKLQGKNKKAKIRRAKTLAKTQNPSLNSEPKFPVAIGPECQAEVAEWKDKEPTKDVESDKFLGTKVWPVVEQNSAEGSNAAAEAGEGSGVGKGRPETCSCAVPESQECIERHACEALTRMKSELGPVYGSWKFEEMGDSVFCGGRKLRSRCGSKSARLR